mgnify:FL=1
MRRTASWGPLMLHSEQDSWPAWHSAQGLPEAAGGHGRPLMDLAREIEDTQRRQSDTLQHIVKRLRALELMPSTEGSAAQPSQGTPSHDEPWDAASAEALMQTYESEQTAETAHSAPRAQRPAGVDQGSQQDWLGQPFHDVTQRIKRTLSDLKPGTTIALLEERLDQFQHHINLALEDVVRRADLEGLRRIEEHVSDLDQQLQQLERHVQRLDGIEADVRQVMDQVSDERLAKLLDYNARFAADLDAVAMRAAEEVHARLGQENHEANARRHQELTALIEASLQDRRYTDTEASTLVQDLSGHVTAQADRYSEIKSLLEETRREQRQSEQTALGMLDTLQQALVRVLDRMDALELQHVAPAQPEPAFVAEPQPDASFHSPQNQIAEIERHFSTQRAAPAMPGDTRFDEYSPTHALDEIAPAEVPASYVSPVEDTQHSDEDNHSTIERLRRDFVADARRAKLKAAANRAEAMTDRAQQAWQFEDEKPAQTGSGRRAILGGASRLFGSSPKLIAGVLALVVAINGALLLLARKDNPAPAIPEINVPGAIEHGTGATPSDSTGTGQRSALDDLDADFAGYGRQQQDTGLSDDHRVTPYGALDDVLNPPPLDPTGDTASAPPGTTIVSSAVTQQEEAVAGVYEQQVLAGLSGQLGAIASKQTPDAMLPEKTGRILDPVSPAAAHSVMPAPAARVSRSHDGALDLPPATVGPLSLRLAAANGDASAQFEVGARLAEGKGTSQNFVEAARWYQLSAAKGFAQSQYRLGTLYERGLGVKKDLARARVWYGRAAEQGNVKAMHNLAVIVAGNENEPDYKTALHWFSEAAEHGLADSQFNLGVLYENGLGVAADRVAAYKWYALAAKGGDADAGGLRDALKAKMSADERKKAEQLVNTFRARPPSRLANDALAAGEDWKRRAESDTNT